MQITDPVADMLTRIRNANSAKHETVDVAADNNVTVKGLKGTLIYAFHPDMILKVEGNTVIVDRPDEEHLHKSLHGLTRTLIANMVEGVDRKSVV